MESLNYRIGQLSMFVAIIRVNIGDMRDVFCALNEFVCHTPGTVTYQADSLHAETEIGLTSQYLSHTVTPTFACSFNKNAGLNPRLRSASGCSRRLQPAFLDRGGPVRRCSFFAALLLCVCFSVPTFAQSTYATVTGTVEDPSRALLPGVTVTATNNATGVVSNAVSNESGAYNMTSLLPGTYTVQRNCQVFRRRPIQRSRSETRNRSV